MTEPTSLPWPSFRRSVFLILVLLCASSLIPSAASAFSPMRTRAEASGRLFVPNAFRLSASNGFTLYVIANRSFRDHPASLTIYAVKGYSGAIYNAPATVTETSMQADLGDLGEIALTFHPTNRPTKFPCGKHKLAFDSGVFEGVIDFHGEEEFTSVEATTVPGDIKFEAGPLCSEESHEFSSEVGFAPPHGASLYVRNPGLGAELSVRKKRAGAATEIDAWFLEYVNGISIERFASRLAPSAVFKFDRRLRHALVRPSAPFSGSGRFDLSKKAGQRWSGDLTVDLPGKRAVPLTGPTLRATLHPAG